MKACHRCGCVGLHACIGHRVSPMTAAEKEKLAAALKLVAEATKK